CMVEGVKTIALAAGIHHVPGSQNGTSTYRSTQTQHVGVSLETSFKGVDTQRTTIKTYWSITGWQEAADDASSREANASVTSTDVYQAVTRLTKCVRDFYDFKVVRTTNVPLTDCCIPIIASDPGVAYIYVTKTAVLHLVVGQCDTDRTVGVTDGCRDGA